MISSGIDPICVKLVNGEEILAFRYLDENGMPLDYQSAFDRLTPEDIEAMDLTIEEAEILHNDFGDLIELMYPIKVISLHLYNERLKRIELKSSLVKYLQFSDDDSINISASNILTMNSMNIDTYHEYNAIATALYEGTVSGSVH